MTRNLRQYGDSGWMWDRPECAIYGMPRTPVTYRTNGRGSGLWECGTHEGNEAGSHADAQIRGTCQFALPDYSDDPAVRRRALRIIRKETTP